MEISSYFIVYVCVRVCLGFSRQIVGILEEFGAEFRTFNILVDEEVRQGTLHYL